MVKYFFRVFDGDELKVSAIVPQDYVFQWIDKYQNLGVVKCHVVNDEESEDK